MPPRRLAIVLVVLGFAACSDTDEEFEQGIRDDCASLEIGTTTLDEGRRIFGEFEVFVECRGDFEPLANQTCEPGTPVCQLRWQFPSRSNCGPGGCTLVCEVRTADVANGGRPPVETPICARRFLDQQAPCLSDPCVR